MIEPAARWPEAEFLMLIAGVDGCHGGWLCLRSDTSLRRPDISVEPRFASLAHHRPSAEIVAVDIPIGLWDRGDRDCDKAARALLGWPRRCSVFPPPPRFVLKGKDYPQAKELSVKASGKGLSKQSWAISSKIREVDQWITPRRQKRVYEVHPEVSFSALNQGRPLRSSKKSREGREERLRLLRPHIAEIDELLNRRDREKAAPDDVIDAAVALWTAQRIAAGKESRLASHARDRKGLRMEIVY